MSFLYEERGRILMQLLISLQQQLSETDNTISGKPSVKWQFHSTLTLQHSMCARYIAAF
jgi:hypothetical protein